MAGHADVARALIEALNARDADAACEACTESVVLEPISTDRAARRPYVGHDGVHNYFADIGSTWAVLRLQPKEVQERGRYVSVVATIRARSLDGSFEREADIGLVLRMNQERVAGVKVYADAAQALAVLDD